MMSDMMKISGFKIYTLDIPMRFSVSHTLAERKTARNIFVCAIGDNGLSGWGESCPRPYVTGETIDTVKSALLNDILPPMIGASFMSMEELTEALTSMLEDLQRNRQAAFCAAELAVLDLAGKTFGTSVGELIGPTVHRKVRYSGVIAAGEAAKVRKYARLMRFFGFKEIKVKVRQSLEANLELLEIVRDVLGWRVGVRIDANCAWTAHEAIRQLEAMLPFDLAGVEQPVGRDDYEGMKQVTAAKLTPVVADESLCSLADAERLIAEAGCDIFNIRVSKCGGLINSFAIYRKAIEAGLSCQLGAHVGESAILSAAGRHIATRCQSVKWCEGSYGRLLLKRDIARPDITVGFGGWARELTSPGLGVEPIAKRINAYKVDRTQID
jgi:muconate cycloisomerase